jgi:hypothetical protein
MQTEGASVRTFLFDDTCIPPSPLPPFLSLSLVGPSASATESVEGDMNVSEVCGYLDGSGPGGTSGSREAACKGNFVLAPGDALVVFGCTPPSSQYVSLQTNVMAKWVADADATTPQLWFPEVSPYDTLNNDNLNTSAGVGAPNGAFVSVSTAR